MTADAALDLVGTWVRVLSLRTRLFAWYDRHRRDLPWRRDADPYRVLVSEVMLQQTRVDVVVPYFERWIAKWPTVRDLAAAPIDDALAAWSGLGYYRRARSLHAAAQRVVGDCGGAFPCTAGGLRDLPGVGPYTAAAVVSIAFGQTVAVVDGNVERVLCRVLADQRAPGAARRRTVEEAARRLVTAMVGDDPHAVAPPEGLRAGDWNQALMELGAVVCLPREPRCVVCPWARSCVGNRAGLAAELPRRRAKKATVAVTLRAALVRRGDDFLLVRRPEGTLLSGLWELPTAGDGEDLASLAARVGALVGRDVALAREPARSFRHTITNRRIVVHVHETRIDESCVCESSEGVAWISRHDLVDFGVSSMTRKALAARRSGRVQEPGPCPTGGQVARRTWLREPDTRPRHSC
jgi:A/G-specific adenine glycosylase